MAQPKLLSKIWASLGLKTDIPETRTSGLAQSAATYEEGFPQITMTPITQGGKAPSGKDMNGILRDITEHIVYQNKGGKYLFDDSFAEKIGGYEKGAVLITNDFTKFMISLVNQNKVNFNTSNYQGSWAVIATTDLVKFITPKSITATSKNSTDSTGHTHEITKASTTQAGIVQLTNDTGLDSEVLALTAKAGKYIAQAVAQLQLSTTNALNQKVNKTDISNAVNSTSQTTVASSQAVKTVYDLANSKYTAQDASQTQKGLVQLANNLTTDDATKALTAAQGKALKDKIDEIEIGGRNLIKNSRLLNGTNHWTVIGGQDLRNGIAVLKSLDTSTEWWWRQSFNLPEKQYTFSAEVKPERTAFYIHLQNERRWLDFYARNLTPGVWQKISITFVSAVRQITFVNPGEGLVELQNPMLVEGNRAMTWAPAPEDAEDYNRQNYVAKSGDTMTGILNINHAASYLRGKNNGVDDWFVGRVRDNDNDVALVSYQYSTGVHLKADRVESNKPIYHGANKVFDEGNLLPVKQINLRSHIPNTQIEYQNATPAELPMGSYIGFTTNAQLSGNGVFSGWGFVSKTDNTQAFRQAVNFDRHFAQWGNNASGWGSVHEYFMLRPQLGASNLNNVTMCGMYSQMSNANTQSNLNYPAQEAGTLLVTPSAYGYQQEYTTFYSNKKFVRGREGNRWLPWKQIDGADWSEVRNKPTTASGLGINDFDNRVTALFTYQKIGNFEIRKYPDGTMIQTHCWTLHDLINWSQQSFVWAHAFVGTPQIYPHITTSVNHSHDVGVNVLSISNNTTVYYHLFEHSSINQRECRIQFLAIGRWR
ncbi:tail fiber protein [Glaesserella parasuis]|uniref:tail fiber protein n=3 Tax=Glaesserella parasuis TaxID=738 RepID=UPI002436DA27|nr:tail fiber protein [Glaesserella parasuis]MDG6448521.1 tail fiber protein [Glaesserella parasuis]